MTANLHSVNKVFSPPPPAKHARFSVESLNTLVHKSLHIHSHFDLLMWLQGDIQPYIPHELMIAAWGDFTSGAIYVDIISTIPGVRTKQITNDKLITLLRSLFKHWENHSKTPFTLNMTKGIFHDTQLGCIEADANLKNMRTALVHGLKDQRVSQDCLYVFIDSSEIVPTISRKMAGVLVPYIDSALRQLDHLPNQTLQAVLPAPEIVGVLSNRESEIMDWVMMGKTNQDIGMILNISAFTVKNHLQRIFRKLDVLNRAQAVSEYNRMYQI
ncbi:MAG: transcriptional regulator EpsA [Methylotenera sp.]|nr:transcriptional regulator EpsA [Methylotenera sp.]